MARYRRAPRKENDGESSTKKTAVLEVLEPESDTDDHEIPSKAAPERQGRKRGRPPKSQNTKKINVEEPDDKNNKALVKKEANKKKKKKKNYPPIIKVVKKKIKTNIKLNNLKLRKSKKENEDEDVHKNEDPPNNNLQSDTEMSLRLESDESNGCDGVKSKAEVQSSLDDDNSKEFIEDHLNNHTDSTEKTGVDVEKSMVRHFQIHENDTSASPSPRNHNIVGTHSEMKRKLDSQSQIDHNVDLIRCSVCEQKLDNNLKFHTGGPSEGFTEDIAILDSRLLLFSGEEENVSQEDTRAYNKITSFSVFCTNNHLCPIDAGLIEKDIEVYMSGYVKPIYSDDPSIENGVPGRKLGPIVHWWITGFDVGEKTRLAFSTEIGDYLLMEPSDEYASFMHSVNVKILISKIIIEYLAYQPDAAYEDLLSKLQNSQLPDGMTVTEDTLFEHAHFICDQVMSFDETAKPWEPLMVVAPCIRRLIDLAGIAFDEPHKQHEKKIQGNDTRKELLRKKAENYQLDDMTLKLTKSELIDYLIPKSTSLKLAKTEQKRSRCGSCSRCKRVSCRNCSACKKKNFESCFQRRCFFRDIQEANDEDMRDRRDHSQIEAESALNAFKNMIQTFTCFQNKNSWVGSSCGKDKRGNVFYKSVEIDDEVIEIGDFVFVKSTNPSVPKQVLKVVYMWEDKCGMARFHGSYLWSGQNTILGELANKKELFLINKCDEMTLACVTEKAYVLERDIPQGWNEPPLNTDDDEKSPFYCQKSYDPMTGRFEDLQSPKSYSESIDSPRFCKACEKTSKANKFSTPTPVRSLSQCEKKTYYAAVTFNEDEYFVGSAVYLRPKTLYFKYPMLYSVSSRSAVHKDIEYEKKYPELYRKLNEKINNVQSSSPYDIAYITGIFVESGGLHITVKKLYRPENTHRGEMLSQISDRNLLFWSDEEFTVPFHFVVGKCYLAHGNNLPPGSAAWSAAGPDRWYFTQIYKDNELFDIDGMDYASNEDKSEIPDYNQETNLKTLDIFAGCGGLSLGLRQAGVADSYWAIESNMGSAQTYKLNSPNTAVFVEDCDILLKKIMKGETKLNGQDLPLQGQVELLCSSLPCENIRTIDCFKNSSIATFIAYCNYYSPCFFVLEADERLIRRSVILKLTIACFIRMGYQVAFDLLQVGCYGAPQNCKKSVLLGAAPGYKLPSYPKHLYAFPKSFCPSGIIVDGKKYFRKDSTDSAPYRTTTLKDAISDLPTISTRQNEENTNTNNYIKSLEYASCYQKMMRMTTLEPYLTDHVCKDLGPLVLARIMNIPTSPDSDWRNLPNIVVPIQDGKFTKKLEYNYVKETQGRPRPAVCGCASGRKCEPDDRQEGCLIPWYLAHSADRHEHWRGLYSRLSWDGYMNGGITNPEPLSDKGPVIHPSQHRVVSVREMARAQGFPDDFILARDISLHDKYQQIGSATSPLLALAIGREIAKSAKSRN